jgi:RNA polymerase sigma factor (sigma-70 family)
MALGQANRFLRHIQDLVGADRSPDEELVQRFAVQRDEAAFEALVRRHGPMVLAVCRRILRNGPDVEDAFQATFLVLTRKAASLRGRDAVGSWLYGVAYRLALRARTDAARRRAQESRALQRPAADPWTDLTVREAQTILDAELARLPDKYRAPLVLCCLEGRTRDEAAQQLAWPASTLKSRLEEARAVLRRRLARRGLTLPAALLGTLLVEGTVQAAVPAGLRAATVQGATACAAGETATGVGSAAARALAARALRAMLLTRLKVAAVLLVGLTFAGAGIGWAVSAKPNAGPVEATDPAPPPSPFPNGDLRAAATERPETNGQPGPGQRGEVRPQVATGWQLRSTLAGHPHGARALTFSPDGARLVSGGDDGRVRVWDVGTARELLTLSSPKARPIRAVALGREGNAVAAGNDDGTVLVWDLHGRRDPGFAFTGFAPEVRALSFGIDSASLTWARSDGSVEQERRPDAASVSIPGRQGDVRAVAFSPDGRTAAWGMQDGSVRLWDVAARTERGRFPVHGHQVWCVAFAAGGQTVASVDHFGTVRLWDAATGREQAVLRNPCRGGHVHVQALAFSPDGSLVATGGGLDHTIRVWETRSGRQLAHLLEHQGPILGLAFSPDGRLLASASADGSVRLWTPTRPPGSGGITGD